MEPWAVRSLWPGEDVVVLVVEALEGRLLTEPAVELAGLADFAVELLMLPDRVGVTVTVVVIDLVAVTAAPA